MIEITPTVFLAPFSLENIDILRILQVAVLSQCGPILCKLLESGISPNLTGESSSLLEIAVRQKDTQALYLLFEHGASTHVLVTGGSFLLNKAVEMDWFDMPLAGILESRRDN